MKSIFMKKDLGKTIKKFDQLMEYLVLGLHKNDTVTRKSLFLWCIAANRNSIEALVPKSLEADNEMVPDKKVAPTELRRFNMERTYKIQEGAAQGSSICKRLSHI